MVWGVDLSYYTGKLEAILRAKGIAYERRDQTVKERARTSHAVGIEHMPIVERTDGSFLSDSTLIHRWLEDNHSGPSLSPADPKARFIARLIEDWGDEHWWRPAMAWRWLYAESRHVASARIVDQAMVDMPLPRWMKKRLIQLRQTLHYVYLDGVRTKAHRKAVEDHYRELLSVLEPILKTRPYIMGDRPTEADFGMFGPLFRHFFGDAFSGPVMQSTAPHVMLWVARLWAVSPEQFEKAPEINAIPNDLAPVLALITRDYLPYLTANANAVAAKQKHTTHHMQGLDWKEQTKPFRLWCLAQLQDDFAALSDAEQAEIETLLGSDAVHHLSAALPAKPVAPPTLPIIAEGSRKPVDSWMR